jgi:hypothetical protein
LSKALLEVILSARIVAVALLFASPFCFAQNAHAASPAAALPAKTTLPIVFTRTVSASHSKTGDTVLARTTQVVRLSDGTLLPAGTKIVGHVVSAEPFSFDHTPYARQRPSALVIQFEAAQFNSIMVPLRVTLRAMAGPIAANDAREPRSSDMDPLGTLSQIGGDLLVPSQKEVVNPQGDIVAYNRRDGVYAHLIANGPCDASDNEVSVGIFSPTACGLYGFGNISAQAMGSVDRPSQVTLVSTHGSPQIWKHTVALLEVLPESGR